MDVRKQPSKGPPVRLADEAIEVLLAELAADLRQNQARIRDEWARRITEAGLLTSLVEQEISALTAALCENLTRVLETGSSPLLVACADNLYQRLSPRGVEAHEVLGVVLLLRDLLARSLLTKYRESFETVRPPIFPSAPSESFEFGGPGPETAA